MHHRSRPLVGLVLLLALFLLGFGLQAQRPTVGPAAGALLLAGGGPLGRAIIDRFLELAGGPDAPIVVIPTAGAALQYGPDWPGLKLFTRAGATNLTVLHTRDPREADSADFVQPLLSARGVWIPGGRQWRLVDAYLHTRVQRELAALLARGGVIGGTSAGASILGSFLIRGAREGNHIVSAPDYEEGFGFLRGVAIDQHLLARKRQDDLVRVIRVHPDLLGIGIDEGTAIVVEGDRFEILGRSKVAIYEDRLLHASPERPYYFLEPGASYNLKTREAEDGL